MKKLTLTIFLSLIVSTIYSQSKGENKQLGATNPEGTKIELNKTGEVSSSDSKVRINRTIKLDYKPKGVIVKFNFDNMILYTDTTALFSIYKYSEKSYILQNNERVYSSMVRKLILNKIKEDSVIISGSFIPFDEKLHSNRQIYWRVWLALRELTITNKIQIYDSNGDLVKKVKIKKIGKKSSCFYRRAFVNKKTHQMLFIYEDLKFCSGTIWVY